MRNRDLERFWASGPDCLSQPAKIISLTNYSARRESKNQQERLDLLPDTLLEDLDDAAVTFGDVAGLDDVKNEIRRRIVLPYLKPTLFERYRQKPGGSLLALRPSRLRQDADRQGDGGRKRRALPVGQSGGNHR